jgi:hypothetical protein
VFRSHVYYCVLMLDYRMGLKRFINFAVYVDHSQVANMSKGGQI